MRNHKGQATPGLMLGVGTVMLLFLLIAVFTLNNQIKLYETEDYIEKRSECLKMANLINSVYVSGPGTEVRTTTDYVITVFNNSQISVGDIASINESGQVPKIAFLASEAGPTTRDFYDQVNAQLDPDPDWYKTCFDDIGGGPGCQWQDTSWIDSEISLTIHDLMNDLDRYNTIYLEDATMNYEHYATEYITRLENWVSAGNALILSEHVFCSESTGTHSYDSYRCDGPGSNDNNWEMFGVSLNQRFSAWGFDSQYNTLVVDTDEAFDLSLGDQMSFEERPYVNNDVSSTGYEAENLDLSGGYYSSTSCVCSSPSNGRCARHSGSIGAEATVLLDNFPETAGEYEITVRYCDESDDSGDQDDYTLYLNGAPISNWQSSDGYGSGQIWTEHTITTNLETGDDISLGAIRGSSSTYTRVDWIDVEPTGEADDNNFKVIARYRDYWRLYDSRNQPAIAQWDYGNGKIFYFGDFLVDYINIPNKDFSQVLVDLISMAYYLIVHPEQNSDINCHFSAFAPYDQVYGDIIIKNMGNYISLENVQNSSVNGT